MKIFSILFTLSLFLPLNANFEEVGPSLNESAPYLLLQLPYELIVKIIDKILPETSSPEQLYDSVKRASVLFKVNRFFRRIASEELERFVRHSGENTINGAFVVALDAHDVKSALILRNAGATLCAELLDNAMFNIKHARANKNFDEQDRIKHESIERIKTIFQFVRLLEKRSIIVDYDKLFKIPGRKNYTLIEMELDTDDSTVFESAAKVSSYTPNEIANLILSEAKKCSPNCFTQLLLVRSGKGDTSLNYAVMLENKELVDEVLKNAPSEIIRRLLETSDIYLKIPIMNAFEKLHQSTNLKIIKSLLENGKSINSSQLKIRDHSGQNILDRAKNALNNEMHRGSLNESKIKLFQEIVKVLSQHEASIKEVIE